MTTKPSKAKDKNCFKKTQHCFWNAIGTLYTNPATLSVPEDLCDSHQRAHNEANRHQHDRRPEHVHRHATRRVKVEGAVASCRRSLAKRLDVTTAVVKPPAHRMKGDSNGRETTSCSYMMQSHDM